jgi:hypothetical protein
MRKGKNMDVTTGRQIVLAARTKGKPQLTDFRVEEATIPAPIPDRFCSLCSIFRWILTCGAAWMTGNRMPSHFRSAM